MNVWGPGKHRPYVLGWAEVAWYWATGAAASVSLAWCLAASETRLSEVWMGGGGW